MAQKNIFFLSFLLISQITYPSQELQKLSVSQVSQTFTLENPLDQQEITRVLEALPKTIIATIKQIPETRQIPEIPYTITITAKTQTQIDLIVLLLGGPKSFNTNQSETTSHA